ncbi:MAG: DUF928 domain-containing protein [Cyanobacteria bacterium J055]|nr:MAG: DUF928 domain-containing protein [Cyanobacteria bacterium J055]
MWDTRINMAWTNPLLNLTVFSLGLSLELAIGASASAQSATRVGSTPTSAPHQTWMVSRFNPPDRGAPNTAVGGATRGTYCDVAVVDRVTPLMPKDSKDRYFGLTVADNPTFFWHSQGNPSETVMFYLYEVDAASNETLLYEAPLNLPEEPGIVGFNLPPHLTLEAGKSYHWYVEMNCDDTGEVGTIVGWLDRVDADTHLDRRLRFALTPSAQSKIYAESGIWFDSLDTLAQARLTADSPELAANWAALLEDDDVQLGNFAREPFLDCCREAAELPDPRLTTQN